MLPGADAECPAVGDAAAPVCVLSTGVGSEPGGTFGVGAGGAPPLVDAWATALGEPAAAADEWAADVGIGGDVTVKA